MQGLTLMTANPVLANGISGLAASATAQAAVEVCRQASAVTSYKIK